MTRVLLLLIFLYACAGAESGSPPFTPEAEAAVIASQAGPQSYWTDWFEQADSIQLNQYLSTVVFIDGHGQVGSLPHPSNDSTQPTHRILRNFLTVGRDTQYVYTLYRIERANQADLAELSILKQTPEGPKRELVFTAPYNSNTPDEASISAARNRWMQYCNAHKVDKLIKEVYTPNALYYNHKPLVQGRAALIEEYAYMAHPKYNLYLQPLHLEAVSEKLYIELGQCYGSYGGQYSNRLATTRKWELDGAA